ncbi:MAG: DegV family protein [Oscillospiraceae bacterium]
MTYQIITDATADLNAELLAGLPEVRIIPMNVQVNGREYLFGPGGNIDCDEFYAFLRNGQFASTSQINPATYREYFEPILQEGRDMLYLCFSSGLSRTVESARMAIAELQEAYPERTILCLDTLCAAVGEGLFVMEAARKQRQGMDIRSLYAWLEEHRLNLCHWVTVDTFDHLKHGGRVSATSAAVGTMLGIKPLIHVDENGKLVAVGKPRGKKKALEALVSNMEKGWLPEISRKVIIGHGDSLEVAQELRELVAARFPEAEIFIAPIGPVIGAHAGPGVMTVFFWGDNH